VGAVAYGLMVLYLAIPHLRMNDKPWMQLDLPRREFTFFGTTFLPTDTLLFMFSLGSLVIAAGVGPRREETKVGGLTLSWDGMSRRHDLTAGVLAFLDLAPGVAAKAAFEFRETARMGRRTRRVAVPVAGGAAGLLVDLRDVPLRLPDRRDRRRALLAAWSAQAWPVDDR